MLSSPPDIPYDHTATIRENVQATLFRTRLNLPDIVDEVTATIEGFIEEERFIHVEDRAEIDVDWYKAHPDYKTRDLYLKWNTQYMHAPAHPDELPDVTQGGADDLSDDEIDRLFADSIYKMLPIGLRRKLIADPETYKAFYYKAVRDIYRLRGLATTLIIRSLAK